MPSFNLLIEESILLDALKTQGSYTVKNLKSESTEILMCLSLPVDLTDVKIYIFIVLSKKN